MLCRVCLEKKKLYIDMFSAVGLQLNISQILHKHLCFQAEKSDISSRICNDCWLTVSSFHEFYESVEQAQARLKQVACKQADNSNNEAIVYELKEQILEVDSNKFVTDSEEDWSEFESADKVLPDSVLKETSCSTVLKLNENECVQNTELKTVNLQPHTQIEDQMQINNENEIKENNALFNNGIGEIPSEISTSDEDEEDSNKNFIEVYEDIDDFISKSIDLKCDICQDNSLTFSKMNNHMKTEHNVKGYVRCCGKKLLSRCNLLDHIAKHKNPGYFKCHDCFRQFADADGLRKHMLKLHGREVEKTYNCDECSKSFSKHYLLLQHLEKSHKIPAATCKISSLSIPDPPPVKTQPEEKKGLEYMCDMCAKIIKGTAAFEKHRREHLGIALPRVQCLQCGTWLKDKNSLRKHIRGHADGKTYTCEKCGKELISHPALLRHIGNVHKPAKHICCVCKKAFKKVLNLKEHMTQHTGEVLYHCEFCPKTYTSNSTYFSHRKKAHPKEYAAWVLKRRMKGPLHYSLTPSIDSNKEDVTQHAGDVLYKCEFCTKAFRFTGNVAQHCKTMHPQEYEAWILKQREKTAPSVATPQTE